MRIITLIFIFSVISSTLFAEDRQNKVDSLQLVLKTCSLDTNKVNTLIELSHQLYEMDVYPEAINYATQAQALAETLGFKSGLARSYRRIGAIKTEQGLYPEAIEVLLKAMHIYESQKNAHGIFMLNNNIGTVYYFQNNYQKALEYYFKSYSYKNNDALTCANIGMVYIESDYTLALLYFTKALNFFQINSDTNNVATMLNNIGTIYEYENKNDSALIYYFRALKIKQHISDYKGEADVLGSIGDAYFKKGRYKEALFYENECLALSNRIGYLNGSKLTYLTLSNIFTKLNQSDKAFAHYKQFIVIRDSMYSEENTKRTVRAEMNFDFQKKEDRDKMEQEKKDAIQNEILKRRQILLIAFVFGFAIILIFSFFLFVSYKRIRKAKDIIAIQKQVVEHKSKEVSDSINYAERIQRAMLPSDDYIKSTFPNNFIIYRPKDILSGDFYWAYTDGINKYFAVADCTGHGIPASMLTMIGTSMLNEIVIERKITSPELILNALREEIIKALNKQGASEERKDGMDIAFYKISGMQLECACANNSIFIIRNKELIELKSNRFPVGKHVTEESFTLKKFDLQKSDIIYSFSDGFSDQFGEKTGKKLMSKKFKEWLIELSPLEMPQIKFELEARFNQWIGTIQQIDDVTVCGIQI